jgi:DNA-binding MarR family transcriptional regulator
MPDQEYYTQEELQELFGVTYYKIKEAIDKLSASGDIVVERRNIDQRKKFVHRKYVPKIGQFFGIQLEGF